MYCKRSNSTRLQISAPPPVQNNFAQLLANVHYTPDMTVPKTFGKKKQTKKIITNHRRKKEEETRKQEKNNKRKRK